MTIVCDDDGKFQIIHYPPLPIEDSIAILQILEVEKQSFFLRFFFFYLLIVEIFIYNGRNS
jgi:hypothetical protein